MAVTLVDWSGFGEYSKGTVVDYTIDPFNVSNHIIVEHTNDFPSLFLGIFRQSSSTIESLFFARKSRVDDAIFKLILTQYPCGLYRSCHATGIVIGPRRIIGKVIGVGDARIDITTHDYKPIGIFGSALNCYHIIDPNGFNNASAIRILIIFLITHFQTAPTIFGNFLEGFKNPSACSSDTSIVRKGVAQGMAGAEICQSANVFFNSSRIDFFNNRIKIFIGLRENRSQ